MAIVYRTAGAWGSGKGSNLTPGEVDANFHELAAAVLDLQENPPDGVHLVSFAVAGSNLYANMSDSSQLGPYALPVAQWTPRGEWIASRVYAALDFVTVAGGAYLVNYAHTSAATFDPYRTDGLGHNIYTLLFSAPTRSQNILFFCQGTVSPGEVLFRYDVTTAFTLPDDLEGSRSSSEIPPSDAVSYSIRKNGEVIGSVGYLPSGGASFWFLSAVSFAVGDILSLVAPDIPDPDHADISFSFKAYL
jgi:hypothetical protein